MYDQQDWGNIPLDQILAAAGVQMPAAEGTNPDSDPTTAGQPPEEKINFDATPMLMDPRTLQANQEGGFYPGQDQGPSGLPVDQSTEPRYPGPQYGSTTTSGSATHQESSRGYDPRKAAQADQWAAGKGGIDGQLQAISQKSDQYLQDYQNQQEVAAQAGRDAVAANTKVEREKIIAQGRDSQRLSEMNQSMAIEESKQTALAAAKTHEYMTKYEESLQSIRGVDPRQLWGSLGSGMQLGMLGAAFAQGMFALKGVNLGVMDNWNRAVDRNIDAQVQNIKKGLDVADGFRKIWDMSRADSATETEARLRVRGYMLQSFQDQVASEMAGYDSKLAAAKGQAGLAQIETELTKNKGELAQIANSKYNAEAQNATHVFATKASLTIATNEHLDRQAALRASTQPKPLTLEEKLSIHALVVKDPAGTGVLGIGRNKEDTHRAAEDVILAKGLQDKVNRYAEMAADVGRNWHGTGSDMINSAYVKRAEKAGTELVLAIGLAYGKTRADASPGMFEKFKSLVPPLNLTSREAVATTVQATQDLARNFRQQSYDVIASTLDPPSAQDWSVINERGNLQNYGRGPEANIGEGPGPQPAPPNQVVQPNVATGRRGDAQLANPTKQDPAATETEALSARAGDKRYANDTVRFDVDEAQGAHVRLYEDFVAAHPELHLPDRVPGGYKGSGGGVEMPNWGDALTTVAEHVLPPSNAFEQNRRRLDPGTDDEIQTLQSWAQDPVGPGDDNLISTDRQLYAQYLLDLINQPQ